MTVVIVRPAPSLSSLAMPKSSSLGVPSGVTKIFVRLRSRCTTTFRCAWETASQMHEQLAARLDRETAFTAETIDRLAFDELHHEKRPSVRRRSPVV